MGRVHRWRVPLGGGWGSNCVPVPYTSWSLVLFLSSVQCVPLELLIGPLLGAGLRGRMVEAGEPVLAWVLQLSVLLLLGLYSVEVPRQA